MNVTNALLRGFAGIIDLLQFLFFVVFLGLAAMTPVGGGVVGGAAGATICWNASGNIVSGAVNAAYCAVVGAGIGAFAGPIGIVVDTAISWTLGVVLILALFATGRLSFFPLMFAFTTETVPGINAFVPAWSILVGRCIKAHNQKTGTKATSRSVLKFMTGGATSPYGVPSMAAAAHQIAAPRDKALSEAGGRVPLLARSFDGIRAPKQEPHATTA